MLSPLNIRRAIVWLVSFALGTVLSLGLVYVAFGTDMATFSFKYFAFCAISISMIFVIWGDLLLSARILPD